MGDNFEGDPFDVLELPQTPEDYSKLKTAYKRAMQEMGQPVTEPDLQPLVIKLLQQDLPAEEVDKRVVQFIHSYDKYCERQEAKLNKKLVNQHG